MHTCFHEMHTPHTHTHTHTHTHPFSSISTEILLPSISPQDRIIGKKVFKIRGLIPAANFMRIPRLKSQSLGLTGRFLYIQVRFVKHVVLFLQLGWAVLVHMLGGWAVLVHLQVHLSFTVTLRIEAVRFSSHVTNHGHRMLASQHPIIYKHGTPFFLASKSAPPPCRLSTVRCTSPICSNPCVCMHPRAQLNPRVCTHTHMLNPTNSPAHTHALAHTHPHAQSSQCASTHTHTYPRAPSHPCTAYHQIKVSPVKMFAIHLEAMTADHCIHRISISAMYKEKQLRVRVNMHVCCL